MFRFHTGRSRPPSHAATGQGGGRTARRRQGGGRVARRCQGVTAAVAVRPPVASAVPCGRSTSAVPCGRSRPPCGRPRPPCRAAGRDHRAVRPVTTAVPCGRSLAGRVRHAVRPVASAVPCGRSRPPCRAATGQGGRRWRPGGGHNDRAATPQGEGRAAVTARRSVKVTAARRCVGVYSGNAMA